MTEQTPVASAHLPKEMEATLIHIDSVVKSLLKSAATEADTEKLADIAQRVAHMKLLIATPQPGDKRTHMRVGHQIATLYSTGEAMKDCVIADLSVGGVMLELDEAIADGASIDVMVPSIGMMKGHVARALPDGCHVAFDDVTEAQKAAISELLKNTLWSV